MSKNMDMSTRNHDRIVAAVYANLDEVYPTTNPTDGERDSWLDALLDEISECPYVDMLAENWEAIEDRLPDICPDLDDEEQEGWIRKAMADGTRKWLLDHAADVVAHVAEGNPGYLRRDLDALRAVGVEDDAHLQTVGVGYMFRALFAAFGMDPLEDEGEEFDALFDALYEFLLERV